MTARNEEARVRRRSSNFSCANCAEKVGITKKQSAAYLEALAAVGRFGVRGVTVSDAGLLEGILATIGKNGGEEE